MYRIFSITLLICFTGTTWAGQCPRGYKKSYSTQNCEQINVPENGKLNYSGNNWECEKGYSKNRSNNTCDQINVPKNGKLSYSGNDWECKRGFKKNRSNHSCDKVNVPQHAKLNYSGNDWSCIKGYEKNDARDGCKLKQWTCPDHIEKIILDEELKIAAQGLKGTFNMIAGGIATIVTGSASLATAGQSEEINDATKATAKYTADGAKDILETENGFAKIDSIRKLHCKNNYAKNDTEQLSNSNYKSNKITENTKIDSLIKSLKKQRVESLYYREYTPNVDELIKTEGITDDLIQAYKWGGDDLFRFNIMVILSHRKIESENEKLKMIDCFMLGINDKSELVRTESIWALGLIGNKQLMPRVSQLLDDNDPIVVNETILALLKMTGKKDLPRSNPKLPDEKRKVMVQQWKEVLVDMEKSGYFTIK